MRKILALLSIVVFLIIFFCAGYLVEAKAPTPQVPNKPCGTWGEIKSCYSGNPAPCCSFKKG
jgi:uncharacterized protein YneF (UPF0154 family)